MILSVRRKENFYRICNKDKKHGVLFSARADQPTDILDGSEFMAVFELAIFFFSILEAASSRRYRMKGMGRDASTPRMSWQSTVVRGKLAERFFLELLAPLSPAVREVGTVN